MDLANLFAFEHDIPPVIDTFVGAESGHLTLEVADVVCIRHRIFVHEKELDIVSNILYINFKDFFPLRVDTTISVDLSLKFLHS